MAAAAEINVTVLLQPPSGANPEDGTQSFAARKGGTYTYHDRRPFKVAGVEQSVDLAPLASVKLLYGKADAPVQLKVTTADGADQIIPVEGVFAWQSDTKPITALKLDGTGTGVLAFAGD